MKVYCVEDEKYGLMVVCKTMGIAKKEINKRKYCPSGMGSKITTRKVKEIPK